MAEELEEVKKDHPDIRISAHADGSMHIEIPNVPLPPGWNKNSTNVLLIVPPQYPQAMPTFFADPDLRLSDGRNANGSSTTTQDGRPWSSFCWSPERWDMSTEKLWKYVKFALSRFMVLQ